MKRILRSLACGVLFTVVAMSIAGCGHIGCAASGGNGSAAAGCAAGTRF